jgi:hypothetical protein
MARIINESDEAESMYNSSENSVIVLWVGTNDLHKSRRSPDAINGWIMRGIVS